MDILSVKKEAKLSASEENEDEDLVHVFRLGRRDENANSPRPLLIQLASYTQKNLIMQSLYKLKHAELQFKNVVVTQPTI